MNAFSAADVALLQAAASLAAHAPEPMRAAHIPAEQPDIAPTATVVEDRKAA